MERAPFAFMLKHFLPGSFGLDIPVSRSKTGDAQICALTDVKNTTVMKNE